MNELKHAGFEKHTATGPGALEEGGLYSVPGLHHGKASLGPLHAGCVRDSVKAPYRQAPYGESPHKGVLSIGRWPECLAHEQAGWDLLVQESLQWQPKT